MPFYEEIQKEVETIRSENTVLLEEFRVWLEQSGLKKKTVQGHTGNVWFYINEYLVYEDAIRPAEGISLIDGFFNWFFPNKAMWSSVATTKQTVASLKRFYRFLAERGVLERADYEEFLAEVKSQMPVGWTTTVTRTTGRTKMSGEPERRDAAALSDGVNETDPR